MLWKCILKFADFRVLQCVVLCSADVRAIDASRAGITRCGQCDTGVCWPLATHDPRDSGRSSLLSVCVRICECDHLAGMVPSAQATAGFHHSPSLSGLHCTTLHSPVIQRKETLTLTPGPGLVPGVGWPKSHP